MSVEFSDKEKVDGYYRNSDEHFSKDLDSGAVDVFGDESDHQIKYKSLSWQIVCIFMVAEIVSNGTLSLPSTFGIVGIVPGVIILIFLGGFATFTSWLLVEFKLNHPQVHSMGDAGYLIFGPVGREILSAGTVIFAVFSAGSELISGQAALSSLSNNGLCTYYFTLIFAAATLLVALPRQLGKLTWLGVISVLCIIVAGIVGMAGIGASPVAGRTPVAVTLPSNFNNGFLAITNPVFAYAGHFMFFILISEMKRPKDAMKAAYVLQGFSTAFYVVFAVVFYVYAGDTVASPAFLSLSPTIQKVAFGIALPNFLFAGALYAHTAGKLIYVRLHRGTRHLHSHTVWGWLSWTFLNFLAVTVAFILAIAVPIFSDLIGLAAALFAAWFTYGIAGFFWMYDAFHGLLHDAKPVIGLRAWQIRPLMTTISIFTIILGTFICVAGTYTTLKLIVESYQQGVVGKPFTC